MYRLLDQGHTLKWGVLGNYFVVVISPVSMWIPTSNELLQG